MQNFLHGLVNTPPLLTYLFAFVWLAFESCGVPLPNELVLLLLGSLIEQRHSPLELVALALVATAGSLLGATVAYFIGARGGRPLVLRVGRFLRLDERRLAAVEDWFNRSGAFAIGVARITPFVRTVSSFPAGVLRLPLRTFLIATSLGSLIWCAALVAVGYLLGADYMIAVTLIERYTIPAVIVLVALIAGYIWLHQRLSKVSASASAPGSAPSGRQRAGGNGPSSPRGATTGPQRRRRITRVRQRRRR
ncbi:MAG TPA: DedA family protein [Ktedonobacterales bacterium]